MALDYLITNAKIVDGTGKPAFIGDVGIKNGKIGLSPSEISDKTIDGTGMVLVPGFIDAHSHADMGMGIPCFSLAKISQGVTTEIAGLCGTSMAPVSRENLIYAQQKVTDLEADFVFSEDMVHWTTFERYLKYVEKVPKYTNIKISIGHNTLRSTVMAIGKRPASVDEMERMKELLREAMEHGAAGLSAGLIFVPGCYADRKELIELAGVLREYDGIFSFHMRNESSDVIRAVEEVLDIGRCTGVKVAVSHHKVLGRRNWGMQKQTLKQIDDAYREGVRVICDQYPYTRNMTSLQACIPPWHFSEGNPPIWEVLKDSACRASVRDEMENPATPYDNYYLNAGGWSGILVITAVNTPWVEGKTIEACARESGQDPFDVYFNLMIENQGKGGAVFQSMCEEDVLEIASSPYTVVGSDGIIMKQGERVHPRTFGTFPRAICFYVKEKKIMSLEEVIRRMTSMTADWYQLKNKGAIKDGYDADLVLLDYERLRDRATYQNPTIRTEGIQWVMVNGKMVYQDMEMTSAAPGRFIPHRL